MSRGRRGALLAGLALALGGLAASDVAGRESALRAQVGPAVPVVVAVAPVARGARIGARSLGVRRVPSRYAPPQAFASPAQVAGARAAVAIPAGADLQPALLAAAERGGVGALATARAGERIARLLVVGDAAELVPGTRADLLITQTEGGVSRTRIALRGAVVVGAERAPATGGDGAGLPRAVLALLVTVRQAVALTEAQSAATELRALARPASASR